MEETVKPDFNLEELVFQTSRELPTGRVIHDEIGISWEIIAAKVYFCSRNDVKKYADYLPKIYYTVDEEKAAGMVLSVWDKIIEEYRLSIPAQSGRVSDAEEKWKKARPKYERALTFAARFLRPSEDELAYIRERTGIADYTPGYDGEYNPSDIAYDEIAHGNKRILLARMKPVLEQLPIEQSRRLAAFYDGYASLAYIPLVACICIMSEDAKQKLKEQIDGETASAKEQLLRATHHAKELGEFYGILQGGNAKLRGSWKTVWDGIEERLSGSLYRHALRVAALVLLYPVWELKDIELEILMEYAFFLNDSQQREIMDSAKKLLAAGKIQPPHTLAEAEPFIMKTEGEQETLERCFELEIANEVYDM